MRDHNQRSLQPVSAAVQVCQRCGGSGLLRLGDQSFRPCLDCLGQGRLPSLPAVRSVSGAVAAVSGAR